MDFIIKKFVFVLVALFFAAYFNLAISATPEEVKISIEKKNKELQEINNRIQETQKVIESAQEEGKTFKKAVDKLNNQIGQINLGIKFSEIEIEKLGYEIESTQYGINEAEGKIDSKKKTVAEILREIQKKDQESALVVFLKNETLAESIFEIQGLTEINNNLSIEINDLGALKNKLSGALEEKEDKKQLKETESLNFKNKKTISEEIKKEKQNLLAQSKNQEQVYQKQLQELEKLRADVAEEIEKAEEELRLKIDPSALPTSRPGVLANPILRMRITQGYGATGFAKYNYRGKWHNGIDVGAPIGTPILSAEKGRVIFVGDQDNYLTNGKRLCKGAAYGKVVVIKHENNLTTLYGHMSLIAVNQGGLVEKGNLIGYVGKTGWATGPHLHFTVYANQTMPPATSGFPEGTKSSRICGPMPTGGDLNPLNYLNL